MNRFVSIALRAEERLENDNGYDGILLVVPPMEKLQAGAEFERHIKDALKYDPSLKTEIAILPVPHLPAGRLVYAPTGPIDPDYDDVRILQETAAKGIKRALKAGLRNLLVVLEEYAPFENSQLVTLLGVLEALYMPIQLREANLAKAEKSVSLAVYTDNLKRTQDIIDLAHIFESGRFIARDIGGGDPERMSPINIQKYVEEIFSKTEISISVIDDTEVIAKEYPLFAAVNRAASGIDRHRGRIVYLEYNPTGQVKETLLLVGKGVTYDTGGADVKTGGSMVGMSRDKCGAAAVAGFMKIVNELKPKHTKVVGALCLVRNSIGSDCYVADEIITSRSKSAIRIGNTDAEGRMIMADVLCFMKEMAHSAVNPHLFTIATLTGHACLTVGSGYSIAMDNGPAHNAGTASKLQKNGHIIADPFEISTIRREDFVAHRGKTEGDDILQANSVPSSRTPRGHQSPAAFLILASGLDKYGSGSEVPLKYTHLDIAASAGDFPLPATGAPILALAKTFLFN